MEEDIRYEADFEDLTDQDNKKISQLTNQIYKIAKANLSNISNSEFKNIERLIDPKTLHKVITIKNEERATNYR